MSSPKSLLQWLQGAGLESLYHKFDEYGVTEYNLANLQFQDYDQMGIVEPPLRQKLFRLVQAAKREQPVANPVVNTPAPAPAPVVQVPLSLAPTQVLPRSSPPVSQPRRLLQPSAVAKPRPVAAAPLEDTPPQPQLRAINHRGSTDPHQRQAAPPPPPPEEEEEEEELPLDDEPLDDEEYEETEAFLDDEPVEEIPKIRVAVRKRPMNTKERTRGENDVAFVSNGQVTIHEPKQKVDLTKYVESHKFVFDEVFGEDSTNEEIYNLTCKPLVQFFMNKGEATCFAYGQTGSGKTFTMLGDGQPSGPGMGLYALAARDLFRLIASNGERYGELQVWVSFFEIYGGKLFDLLNDRKKLVMREDGQRNVNIVGLRERKCTQVSDLLELMAYGNTVRSTGSTGANIDSSRSHAILQIALKKPTHAAAPIPGLPSKPKLKLHGRFSFIDLAGSERAADTANNDRRTRLEGAEINKSLLALKECIRALDQGGKHLPFRGSQLTQVLRCSLTGNSRTVMVANIGPNSGSCEHTLNTLRYADRVKELKKGQGQGAGAGTPKDYNAYMPHQAARQGNKKTYENDAGSAQPFQQPIPERPVQVQPIAVAAPAPLQQLKPPSAIPKPSLLAQPRQSSAGVSDLQQQPKPFVKPLASALKSSAASPSIEESSDDLLKTHVDLCSTILREEESIVEAHRGQIDSTMKGVKEEMELLKRFDTSAVSVDDYVDRLDEMLSRKVAGINELKAKLLTFKKHLKQEEELSSSFNRKNAADPWGRHSSYDDEDDQSPPNGAGGFGRGGGGSSAHTPSYPHLQPLPSANYR